MACSVIVDGKVLDFVYRKSLEFSYNFYIGDVLVGQVFRAGRGNWTAVSWKKPSKLCPVEGFRSRYHASEFLLKLNGYCDRG